jgi:hypothetical protein
MTSDHLRETIMVNATADVIRTFITETIDGRPDVALLLQEHRWVGNVLHAHGVMGGGTITVADGKVDIDIELSMFGSAVRTKIHEAFHELFKPLYN